MKIEVGFLKVLCPWLIVLALAPVGCTSASPELLASLYGRWEGRLDGGEAGTVVLVSLEPEGEHGGLSGFLSMPSRDLYDVALDSVSVRGTRLAIEIESGEIAFAAEIEEAGLRGSFRQVGYTAELVLAKRQEPGYQETVAIPFSGGALAGTLVLPAEGGRYPAVVLVGTTVLRNRDEYIAGFPVFRIMAEHLSQNGIATLRWDDRGVGRSTGGTGVPSQADFVRDVSGVVAVLRNRPDIDAESIVLLGWGDGGLIASAAAAELSGIDSIILVATPALGGGELLNAQRDAMVLWGGMSESEAERISRCQNPSM